jgi:hypothetical protein
MSTNEIAASEVARRFRMWRMKHRAKTPLEEIEAETQIPVKRIQALLRHQDLLEDYRTHILRFLEAFEAGDAQGLKRLRGDNRKTLPPAHMSAPYSDAIHQAIKQRQLELTQAEGRPYCLVAQQDISARQCVRTQNPRDCFGCGATTRFCVECGFDFVAFPGAELCSFCLTLALNNSETDALNDSEVVQVSCPLSSGKLIMASTCRRMQSDSCGSCNAITRFCLSCNTRRVRYINLAMCLHCYTQMFNPLWEPLNEEHFAKAQAEREVFFGNVEAPQEMLAAATASSLKAACGCGYEIQVSTETIQNTVIRCETCGEPFKVV